MAWSEPAEALCKSHPDHKQPPGVCSCCLRERLSEISGAVLDSSPNASDLYTYSSASSSCSSACVSPRGHRRITSEVAGRFAFITIGGGGGAHGGLKKSRSIAFATRRPGPGLGHGGGKKKEGFWSKLIKSTGKKTKKALLH